MRSFRPWQAALQVASAAAPAAAEHCAANQTLSVRQPTSPASHRSSLHAAPTLIPGWRKTSCRQGVTAETAAASTASCRSPAAEQWNPRPPSYIGANARRDPHMSRSNPWVDLQNHKAPFPRQQHAASHNGCMSVKCAVRVKLHPHV